MIAPNTRHGRFAVFTISRSNHTRANRSTPSRAHLLDRCGPQSDGGVVARMPVASRAAQPSLYSRAATHAASSSALGYDD